MSDQPNEGWVVVRILRIEAAADHVVYPSADHAAAAAFGWRTSDPDGQYTVAHTSYPLDGAQVVEQYAHVFDPAHENDRPIMWTDSVRDAWPANERGGPWAITKINSHPVKVVKRRVIYTEWVDAPTVQDPFCVDEDSEVGDHS